MGQQVQFGFAISLSLLRALLAAATSSAPPSSSLSALRSKSGLCEPLNGFFLAWGFHISTSKAQREHSELATTTVTGRLRDCTEEREEYSRDTAGEREPQRLGRISVARGIEKQARTNQTASPSKPACRLVLATGIQQANTSTNRPSSNRHEASQVRTHPVQHRCRLRRQTHSTTFPPFNHVAVSRLGIRH